jgi:ABC-type branched-subunit amino acid transport system substrate-binding protein
MTKAFTEVLAGSQVRIISQQTFDDGAQTFTGLSAELLAKQPAALFVPAAANQLELIASQLAASGVLPIYKVSRGTADKPGLANPPVKLLLASAEGMGSRLLKNAGRYLQGAVLAPLSAGGLQLSANDQAAIQAGPWAARWEDYAAQVGAEVGVLDALGFEAVRLVQTACGQVQSSGAGNTCTSQQLASKLQTLRVEGSTGPIAFDAQGQRTGEPLLLQVDGNVLRPLR